MTPDDLASTHAAAFTDTRPWTADEFTSLLAQTGMILRGDARSFLLGRVTLDEAEVLTLATHPDFQRQGYGQTHLAGFLDNAKTQGATTAFLEVASDNIPANNLYLNNKFEKVGHRPAYYTRPDGTKCDANVLRRAL